MRLRLNHSIVPYDLRKYGFGSIYCSLDIALIDSFSSSFWILSLDHTFTQGPCIFLTSFTKLKRDFCWPREAQHWLQIRWTRGIAEGQLKVHHEAFYFNQESSWGMRLGFRDMTFTASIQSDHSLVHSSWNFLQSSFLFFWRRKSWFVIRFMPPAFSIHICSRVPIHLKLVWNWLIVIFCIRFRECLPSICTFQVTLPYTSFPYHVGLFLFQELIG